MKSFKMSQFEYSFLKGFKKQDIVYVILLSVICDSLTLLLMDLSITPNQALFPFIAKGVALVLLYAAGVYLTAYFVLKNSSKDHFDIKLRFKIFLRIFLIVVIVFFLHLTVSLSLTLALLSLSIIPDWVVGSIDYTALNLIEVAWKSFLRNLTIVPGYFVHAVIFPAYFYILSRDVKVFESLSLCLRSIGSWVVWLTFLLFLDGVITETLEHSAHGYLYWLVEVISSLLILYVYSGIFLTLQKVNEKSRGINKQYEKIF